MTSYLVKKSCWDPVNYNRLGSSLVDHLTPYLEDMSSNPSGTELEKLTKSGRSWGQVLNIDDPDMTCLAYISILLCNNHTAWRITLLELANSNLNLHCIEKWTSGTSSVQFKILIHQLTVSTHPPSHCSHTHTWELQCFKIYGNQIENDRSWQNITFYI